MTVQRLPAHVLIALLLLATPVTAHDMQIYEHPSLDFRFEAPRGWRQQPRPEDEMIHEVADPRTGVHVVLWYTSTMQSGPAYLKKMASMQDVVVDKAPLRRQIGGREAWVLNVSGTIAKVPARTLLTVIPCGKSSDHPEENALYIVQIWCPEEDYEEHARLMEDILYSLQIVTTPRSHGPAANPDQFVR